MAFVRILERKEDYTQVDVTFFYYSRMYNKMLNLTETYNKSNIMHFIK